MEIQQVGLNAFFAEVQGVHQPLIAREHQQALCRDILEVADQWQSQLATSHLGLQDADSGYNVVLGGMSEPQDFLPSQMYLAQSTMRLAEAAVTQLLSRADLASVVQLEQSQREHTLLTSAEHHLVTAQESKLLSEKQLQDAETACRHAQQKYNDAEIMGMLPHQIMPLKNDMLRCNEKV